MHQLTLAVLASVAFLVPSPAARAAEMNHGVTSSDKIVWGLLDPNQPKGIQIAVLSGDPSKPGPFVVRLKFPAGLEVGSHSHSNAEFVTVLSGTAKLSWGIKTDAMSGDSLVPGTFIWLKGGEHHDLKAVDEAIVELHSTGPFDLILDK
ncbi:MAG: cupin domain-containing protein [Rhizobiales bacterium]|nr:cupin domain-containing protein [Hyphomicrobiales bacterium]